jgi:hypothetical protein
MTKSVVAIVILYIASASAEPTTTDVDKLMRENPPPSALELLARPVHTDTVCPQQTCQRLIAQSGQLPDGSPWYWTSDSLNADGICWAECGDGSFCPLLSDLERQEIINRADAYCFGRLGLPRDTSVYWYCRSQTEPQMSETHCQGGSSSDPGSGGEP